MASPDSGSAKKKSTPNLGPLLLKLADDALKSGEGEGPSNALDYALGAAKCFEICAVDGESNLALACCLRFLAAVYCNLGKFEEGLSVLERAVKAPQVSAGTEHALAVSSGYMQMGDVYNMMERMDCQIESYKKGVKIQVDALGDKDPRVAKAFSYLAKAHVGAQQFDEAESLCKKTLEIHRAHSPPASLEEAADRQLMASICEAKGDYKSALEHLVVASQAMIANGQENEVAGIEAHIGEMLYSVGRYGESRSFYGSAVTKLRAVGESKSAMFGIILNRMGLSCAKMRKMAEAVELFEEAREIVERECGPSHPDTVGINSNLAAIYDNLGRSTDTMEILEEVLKLRKEQRGTTDNLIDLDDEEAMMAAITRKVLRRIQEEKSRENRNLKGTKKKHTPKK